MTQPEDAVDAWIAENMKDPEFAKAYIKQQRRFDRYKRRRKALCRLGLHLLSFSDGQRLRCACRKRGRPA